MTTRAEAIQAAGAAFAEAQILLATLPVEEAARRAYTPTGPSVAELERRIRAMRSTSNRPTAAGVASTGDVSRAGTENARGSLRPRSGPRGIAS